MFPNRPHVHLPSRRRLLGAGAASLASLAVGSGRVDAAPATEPWNGGPLPADARANKRMADAARAFLAALTPAQRALAAFANLDDVARTKWSNFPAGASPRPGVALGDLSDAQRVLLHELLCASASSQGYHKMTGAIRADQVLHDLQGGDALFGSANYYTSVFGSPSGARWAWMLTGHHMSAIFTVAGDRTAFTPMFTGAQPFQIATGLDAGWRVLPHEADRAGQLLATLSAEQRRAAVLGTEAPMDVYAGPGRQAALAKFQGVAAGTLGEAQQRLLWLVVEEFVRNAASDAADAQLALVREHWRGTHFAWQGPAPDPAARYYFRIHGPRILIEYDVQEPLTQNGGHVHALTRDPLNDYGMDWLGLHYAETGFHPPAGGVPGGPGGPGGPNGHGPPGGFGHAPPQPSDSPAPH